MRRHVVRSAVATAINLTILLFTVSVLSGCPVPLLPTARFDVQPAQGAAPLDVAFTDTSIPGASPITARVWSFGFDKHSFDIAPTATFDEPGEYAVALAVINNSGGDVAKQTIVVAQSPDKAQSFDESEATDVIPELLCTRSFPEGEFYPPGGTLLVNVHFDYTGTEPLAAVGQVEAVPDGWAFAEVVDYTEFPPDVVLDLSEEGRVEFFWLEPPPMPFDFRYRLSVPESAAGPLLLPALPLYQTVGDILLGKRDTRLVVSKNDGCGGGDPGPIFIGDMSLEMFFPDGASYEPGDEIRVSVRLDGVAVPPTGVTYIGNIPGDWRFLGVEGVDGPAPSTTLNRSDCERVEFYWLEETPMPLLFTYRFKTSFDIIDSVGVRGKALYETENMLLHTVVVEGRASAEYGQREMSLERHFPEGDTYDFASPLLVELVMTYTGWEPVTALAIYERMPTGWTFEGFAPGASSIPNLPPAVGQASAFEAAWFMIPGFPVVLRYYVNPVATASEEANFQGWVNYRTSGGPLYSNTVTSTVSPADAL